jgi:hypothetical protein
MWKENHMMKQKILVASFTLATLLVALSGIGGDGLTRGNNKSNQDDAKKTELPKVVYDIAGKRLRADEKYIAERTITDGRIIAYRKNKREIAALVKALKEDGVTDRTLLDPQAWNMIICYQSSESGCAGGCGFYHSCQNIHGHSERPNAGGMSMLRYCGCVKVS